MIRLGALIAPGAQAVMSRGPTQAALELGIARYTGYDFADQKWKPHLLVEGWGPYLGAILTTYGIPKLASIIRKL